LYFIFGLIFDRPLGGYNLSACAGCSIRKTKEKVRREKKTERKVKRKGRWGEEIRRWSGPRD
jgi:hypothetical protein